MLASVTTADNGVYGFTDTPVSTGTVSYTVTFGGDPTHLSSSASQGVQIKLNSTSLTISARHSAGGRVTVTAHLGTTYSNRAVTIAANGDDDRLRNGEHRRRPHDHYQGQVGHDVRRDV